MSATTTRLVVSTQLRAMSCELFRNWYSSAVWTDVAPQLERQADRRRTWLAKPGVCARRTHIRPTVRSSDAIERLRFRRLERVLCLNRTIALASGDCAH
jgi:hypothetical protein